MIMKHARIALSALFLVMTSPAAATDVRITDGDGLRLGAERIRLWGIDAPELDQKCKRDSVTYACGALAHQALKNLVGSAVPVCETIERDRYRRTVARCTVGGRDLGSLMVQSGWALDWPRYSRGRYRTEEREAREAGRGLWGGEFIEPWEWRQRQ